jgi:hypothetical protein
MIKIVPSKAPAWTFPARGGPPLFSGPFSRLGADDAGLPQSSMHGDHAFIGRMPSACRQQTAGNPGIDASSDTLRILSAGEQLPTADMFMLTLLGLVTAACGIVALRRGRRAQ